MSEPCLGPEEQAAVAACLSSNWISPLSPLVRQFEQAFLSRLPGNAALALNCGTAAIHLSLRLCDIGPGDLVAVPAMSFVATVNPVLYLGATPVFVDVDPGTFGMDPQALSRALQKYSQIKAIVATHLYGHAADMPGLLAVAGPIPVIEDASEALGSSVNGRFLGSFGAMGCYSFNGNKTITTGSGGMLTASSSPIIERGRHLAMQARGDNPLEFDHTDVGYNYRMNGIQAALGLAQLDKLTTFIAARQAIARCYAEALQGSSLGVSHLPINPDSGVIPWLSTVMARNQAERDRLLTGLREQGIEARPFFKPLPLLLPYQGFARGVFPAAQNLWERGVCLPSSPTLTVNQQNRIIDLLRSLIAVKPLTVRQAISG